MWCCRCLACGNELAIAESLDELPWQNRVRMSRWKRIRCNSCGVDLFVSRYRKKPRDEIWIHQKSPSERFDVRQPTWK